MNQPGYGQPPYGGDMQAGYGQPPYAGDMREFSQGQYEVYSPGSVEQGEYMQPSIFQPQEFRPQNPPFEAPPPYLQWGMPPGEMTPYAMSQPFQPVPYGFSGPFPANPPYYAASGYADESEDYEP